MDSTLSLSEKLNYGLMTTGIGLLVVFCALILIIVVITILTQILKERKKEEAKKEEIKLPVTESEPAPAGAQEGDALTAVLAAAVAAYLDGEKQNGLIIKSYRKVTADNPWSQSGRNSRIYNKL